MAPSIRQSMLAGAVAGVMLTSSLVAVFYLAWRLAGMPFAPFDVFDWISRTLPGSIVTFGIDTIVSVIRTLNLGATAETAKIAEQTMAIAGFLVAGAIAGAVLFALLHAFQGRHAYLFGIAIGAAESIEATDHWEPGYWVERGWDAQARMKATSVIDTVAVDMMVVQADASTRVPIGGIAHAGARGISKVEVQVDGGEWRDAQLRAPLSGLTWVIWRYDWPFRQGRHTFTVRCYDGAGTPQIMVDTPVRPAGASGLHSKSMMF